MTIMVHNKQCELSGATNNRTETPQNIMNNFNSSDFLSVNSAKMNHLFVSQFMTLTITVTHMVYLHTIDRIVDIAMKNTNCCGGVI